MTISLTASDIDSTLPLAADMIKELIRFGSVTTENLETLRAALAADCDWEGSEAIRAAARNVRANYSAFIISQIPVLYSPIIEAYARLAAGGQSSASTFEERFREVVDYWIDNNKYILSRGITTDTAGSSSGTGNPTIRRLAIDRDGFEIAPRYVAAISFEANRVQPNTTVGEEELLAKMSASYDLFSLDIAGESSGGPGVNRTFQMKNRDGRWVKNASFESPGTAGSLSAATTIGAWTIDSGAANLAIVADGYRESFTERSNGSKFMLRATNDFGISQAISAPVNLDAAYDCGFWCYPNATAVAGSGTLVLVMGSLSETFNVSDLTAGTWNFVGFDLTTPSLAKKLWGRNFAAGDAPVVSLTTGGTWAGQIDFDAFEMDEFLTINGTGWHFIPGSTVMGMSYANTFTDSFAGSDSVIQKHLFLGFRKQLPATANATQVTAAGGRTLTYAASGNTVTASSGDFAADGYKIGMLVTSAGTSSNNWTLALTNVSATVLTFASGVSNEGPLSATATLNATPPILDP